MNHAPLALEDISVIKKGGNGHIIFLIPSLHNIKGYLKTCNSLFWLPRELFEEISRKKEAMDLRRSIEASHDGGNFLKALMSGGGEENSGVGMS
ncbi:hypothetical protein K7X08_001268 [Anisodus acutangulus]|uniref:Uncharacterized protein n=1 Tax=Anisodus acutangulus TaxID=402998 RepID=A0A9Q1MRP7_9SOLA|nr:hypothetical protein K7X08_001268 [Anisodus acutangulus]